MTDIVINTVHGGFGLSAEAVERYFFYKGWVLLEEDYKGMFKLYYRDEVSEDKLFDEQSIDRADPDLVRVVKELGHKANGRYASLNVVTIPDDVKWEVKEYDGLEHVAEVHRVWY
jgi:hypothetical protein